MAPTDGEQDNLEPLHAESECIGHWTKQLEAIIERCDFGGWLIDQKESFVHQVKQKTFTVPESLYLKLQDLCMAYDLTFSSILQFVWHIAFSVYGNGHQTVVATVEISPNTLPCHLFENILPVIVDHRELQCESNIRAIKEIGRKFNNALNDNIFLNLEQLKNSQLDSLFVFINGEQSNSSSVAGIEEESSNADYAKSEVIKTLQFPLAVFIRVQNTLELTACYAEELLDADTVDDFWRTITALLEHISKNAAEPVADLEFLTPEQMQKLDAWNNTDADFPSTKRLHHLFEEAVEKSPDKVAVIYEDVRLTYRELNEHSNRLAHHLHSAVEIKPEQFIALLLDKSELMIITVLGVWKSGAAYVPIDPTYPTDRIKFILEDTQAKHIITNRRHARTQRFTSLSEQLHVTEIEPLLEILHKEPLIPKENLHLNLASSQLAYVTYTSGTTGVPKGVFKEHKGVVNSITDLAVRYGIREQPEVIVLFSAYVFEPFVRQTLMALLNSQLLVIVKDDEKMDPHKFPYFLKHHGVTYLNGTASVLQEYDLSNCTELTKMLLVGEEFTEPRYKNLRHNFKHRIISEYGFTESALVTAMKIYDIDAKRTDRSIGRPLRNVKCYILNNNLKRIPFGAIGELHIGGLGVSRGYLNRPELTKEKFIENPFQTANEKKAGINSRIYKTGDLARWLPNGEVEYLGRNDFQLKLRGIRIEPGEIESILSIYPGVQKCIVIAKDAKHSQGVMGTKLLVGYFISDEALPEVELLAYLETKLPRYMMPARLIQIDKIPVTINGKADLRALAAIDAPTTIIGKARARNDLDIELCKIWSETLSIPPQNISISDDFFMMGGHSITCIQLIGRIRQHLRCDVTVEEIFSLKTIEKLSDHIENKRHLGSYNGQNDPVSQPDLHLPATVLASDIDGFYMANSLQQGLMYHYLKQSHFDDAYVMQSLFQYKTKLNPASLKRAWQCAQEKYCALRLRFVFEKDVIQIVDKAQLLDWRFVDLTGEREEYNQEKKIEQLQKGDRKERYHLESGKLFRVYLIKQNEELFKLLLSCHHIILDGWSFPILHAFVHQTYIQLNQGVPILPTKDVTYSNVQKYLQTRHEDNIEYWTHQIERIVDRCNLNGLLNEQNRYKVQLSQYDYVKDQRFKTLKISNEWKFKEKCSKNGITLHSILQFVWHKVLHIYGNGIQTVVGTTISGRNFPIDNIEASLGLFINTLPLIVDHDEQKKTSVVQAIMDIQTQVNAMNSRSNVQLSKLQKGELKHGLFDSLFVLENYPNLDNTTAQQNNKILGFEAQYDVEKLDYPLAVIARETEQNGVTFSIYYAGELFEAKTIDELLNVVDTLTMNIIENLDQPVVDIQYLPHHQAKQIQEWNNTDSDFPSTKTLHHIFEEKAMQFPKKIAIISGADSLSYSELNKRSNRLAYHLRCLMTINPDELIAIFMEKSEHMIVSIFGIWKSGAAYVPIDPSYPDDRIRFILEDTKAKIILTNQHYSSKLRQLSNEAVHIIDIEPTAWLFSNFDSSNPTHISSSTDLAYVIYTSGTTGKPKGVMIEHKGVVNLQVSLANIFGLQKREDEVILSFSNYVFDHFVEQMTDALLNGQTLVILNDEMRTDEQRLYDYLDINKVTYLSGTPSVLSVYEYDKLKHIKRIDAVGEDFSESMFNKIRSTFEGLIINGYGPTEVSITTHKRLYPFDEMRTNKSIGNPVANTKCYVLNNGIKLIPVGAVGELYIGGIGVARGYLNRPDLTSERFLRNPHQTDKEKKLGTNAVIYKTGDLVRWLSNGEIEYLGRNDFQVKVRGLRIELGEIETAILLYPGVTEAVVIAKEHQQSKNFMQISVQKYLIAYFISVGALSERDIQKFLRAKLPEYMVPNRIVKIDKIPVNINGKLDAKLLPVVEFSKSSSHYMAPSSELEIRLCNIWAELLGIPADEISVDDDFFSLGADSLLVTRLSFMLTSSFGRNVSVGNIFKHKTIESLSRCILAQADELNSVEQFISPNQNSFVSFAQERLLFIIEFADETDAYNVPIVVELPCLTNRDILKQALVSVVLRHEILRTVLPIEKRGGVRLQQVLSEQSAETMFHVDEIVVRNAQELDDVLVNAMKHIFKLNEELPIKVGLYDNAANAGCFYMSIVVHHICFDGWSWEIFKRDLKAFYCLYAQNRNSTKLPALCAQYKDFAAWQRRNLTGTRLQTLTNYWLQKLSDFEPLNLMTDFPRPALFDYSGTDIRFELDKKTSDLLKAFAKDLKVSLFSVLISAYCLMLSHYTNQSEIVIGTPIANRNRPELEHMIGFFVNIIVLKLKIHHKATVSNYIREVSGELIQSQVHQEMPFEKLVKSLEPEYDSGRHPIIQVMFGQNSFPTEPNHPSDETEQLLMSNYYPTNNRYTTAKFDMSTTVSETGTNIIFNVNFASRLFKTATVNGFITSYKHILDRFAHSSEADECKIEDIKAIDEANYVKLTRNSDITVRQFDDQDMTLHQIFENIVINSPTRTAVVSEDIELTYQELNERANQLAHYIRSLANIKPDDLIALVLDKSELMVVSIIAVWKTGSAYVPIDPTIPKERMQFILEDTSSRIVITNHVYGATLQGIAANFRILEIDCPLTNMELKQYSSSNCNSDAHEDNLAYVIYTSGTTGRPKGVMVEHRQVVNFRNSLVMDHFPASWQQQQQAILCLSNYVFDFSIEQLVLSILNSNKLIVIGNNITIDDHFYAYANMHQLTYLSGTPTFLQQINLTKLNYVHTVTVAGEVFNKSCYKKFRKEFSGLIINAYGTTETTVYNMVKKFQHDSEFANSLGNVLPNVEKFVLNDRLQLLPHGAIGELYLAGKCLSRGYLNRPDLTSCQFLANPFQTDEQKRCAQFERIYKTGDLVRYSAEGELEYLSRNDQQVKIRGLRIEISEIESVLASYPGVVQAAVLAQESKLSYLEQTKHLVGYFTSGIAVVPESDVLTFMRNKLPNYMIPVKLIRINGQLPLTVNGKLDTRALPEIDFSAEKELYAPPRNSREKRLCSIWTSLLKIDNVGIDDDFFRLGGDSILSLQLVSRIQSQLKLKVSVKDIFLFKTIRRLFDSVWANQSAAVDSFSDCRTEQGLLSGAVPVMPIQKWFFSKKLSNGDYWNQSFTIKTLPLDLNKLIISLNMLVEHHDAFRLRFKRIGDEYAQFYSLNENKILLNRHDVRCSANASQMNDVLKQWQSGFNLENGPTFCVGYLHGYEDGSARIWFAMHHLIVDTVSWRIITQDLHILYNDGRLGPKGSSYRQWAKAIERYSCNDDEREHWNNIMKEIPSFNDHITNLNASSVTTSFVLSVDQTKSLLSNCNHAYDTRINDLLLTALGYGLHGITQRKINYITLEGHGREDIDFTLDISNTVGWFTTMYPVALNTSEDLASSICRNKELLRSINANGIGYGAIYGYQSGSLPRVCFNYLGQFDIGVTTAGFWHLVDVTGDYASDRSESIENASDNIIDVTGLCIDGQMRFNTVSRLGQTETARFEDVFKAKLVQIIEHTLSFTRSQKGTVMPMHKQPKTAIEQFEPYFEFHNPPGAAILFILPPGEGGAESYFNNIAKELTQFKLVLFNNYYLHSKAAQTSFVELAQFYISYIQQLQPQGPYNFLGWSFGGVLSLEISKQMAGIGEKIDNLIFIDSYFNVKKACEDIDRADQLNIIDRINYLYSPEAADLKQMAANTGNVVLFKAGKLNDTHRSDDQLRLFDYYMKTEWNNLDTLLDARSIQLSQMLEDTHVSWVKNRSQVKSMSKIISFMLKHAAAG